MPGVLIHEVEYGGEMTDLLVTADAVIPAPTEVGDALAIDGHGLLAVPGFVDVHVHFRDPGLTEKEDMLTGARAAAAGGYTTVLCEPNTRPVIDSTQGLEAFYRRRHELGIPLSVLSKAAVTLGQAGEKLTDITALVSAYAAGLSDDGEPLVNAELLVNAFRCSGTLVLTAHCEETPRSAGKVAAELGEGPSMLREVELIKLHIEALQRAGTGRLHIQHVSLAESALLIGEAKTHGLSVTAEVTPHHLLLCEEDIPQRGVGPDGNWKMNPPLRSRADMLAIRRALAEGVIDMIATDHAPHTPAEKAQPWEQAPFGIIGLETAFGACMTLVHEGTLSLGRLIEAMSLTPATLLPEWAKPKGDLTLIDADAEWVVDAEKFYSQSRNCPFNGRVFRGKPVATIAGGKLVMQDGEVLF